MMNKVLMEINEFESNNEENESASEDHFYIH